MPQRTTKICSYRGCSALTRNPRFCDKHQAIAETERKAIVDSRRGSSASRGYDHRWRNARVRFLRVHPLCENCSRIDAPVAATVVDHKTPHRGDQYLFWNENNWQALCASCHSRKTVLEDGGFGNKTTKKD